MKSSLVLVLTGLTWLILVCLGTTMMMRYELTPGPPRVGDPDWPAASRIGRSTTEDTLVLFVHPQCPCSRATIDELADVMTRSKSPVRAYVMVLQPAGCSTRWADTGLAASARKIPGVIVRFDRAGAEARRFHAGTSGYTLLYDPAGRLVFSGGLTGARGETGDNAGVDSVLALLSGGIADSRHTAIFGCSLFGSDSGDRKETLPCPD